MTIKSNTYDHLSSRNKRINILLENFHFYHQPTSDKEEDPKYINRHNPEHQLRNWLEREESHHGVYLITGYRGMGKSSLVGKVLHDLKKDSTNNKKKQKDKTCYHVLQVNLGQDNINEKEILRIISKMLYDVYDKIPSKAKFFNRIAKWGLFFLTTLILIEVICEFKGSDFLINIWNNMGIIELNHFLEKATQNKDRDWTKILNWSYTILAWMIFYGLETVFAKAKMPAGLSRLKALCIRLNASVSYEIKFEWLQKLGISRKQSLNYESATVQEIEYELIQIFAILGEKRKSQKFVIILDELDKAEPSVHEGEHVNDIPDYGKVAAKPDHYVTTRERRQQVLRIIGNMKFFLTTAQAYFIFIAGRELYEAFQADVSDRDFAISSIFSNVLNVDSFLISTRNTNNTAMMAEQFVCKQLLPKQINEIIRDSNNRRLYDEKNLYSLKNYYNYRTQKGIRPMEVWRDVLFLYHFTHYLSYISNGSPKKMSMFFEKNVRDYDYLKANDKLEDVSSNGQNNFFLSFGYYTQQKINFIHYLTYPVMQSIINMSNIFGDKLLVSASFLISHIYKFHNHGFSWRNLEQTPELLEINKTPEIREFISSVIDYLNHTHLTTIPCGLYHYKFPMRITEEISYFSKVSSEISSLFNFSLDQLKTIKEHYKNLLVYYEKQEKDVTWYNRESVHHALGDIYMMEEDYSRAIWEYETCVNMVQSEKTTTLPSLNDVLFMTRTMLKLGLAHEKKRTDNSAFVVYETLINYLKKKKQELQDMILFEDVRIMYLALLAKLYVLEKLDTDGIQEYHIEKAVNDFVKLMKPKARCLFFDNKYSKEKSEIVCSDFYRKLGDILYYKNPKELKYSVKPTCEITSAYDAYKESLKSLIKGNEIKTSSENDLASYMFKYSYQVTNIHDFENVEKKGNRDNYLYNIALTCESLGRICFSMDESDTKEKSETKGVINPYRKAFFEDFLACLNIIMVEKPSDILKKMNATNEMERSFLYYWAASRFYNASCERGLSSRCYKEIVFVLSSYMNIFKESEAIYQNDIFTQFLDKIVHLLLINKYHQYEHIHLSEINTLKWIQGRELYEYVELCDLSIAPDIEEIVYAYYTIKLELAIAYGEQKRKNPSDDGIANREKKERESVIGFYKSRLMAGQIICSTLTSSVLNLRLKARINEFLLSKLLLCSTENLGNVRLEDLILYQDRENIFDNEWIAKLFDTKEKKGQFDQNFDVLEFLISDGHFCLSRILEKIIPLRNTTLFNNSFKGDIYYHLIRFTHLYKQLYCYYSYGHNTEKDEKMDVYLSNSKIEGWKLFEGRQVATIWEKDEYEGIILHSIKHPSDIYQRRMNFLKRMTYASKQSNPSKTVKVYLAENAIHYYTKAWQIHHQGKSYQLLIRNLHFLEDDLNNDTCQFYMATERFSLKKKRIQERIRELKQMYKDSYYYDVNSYFVEQEDLSDIEKDK